MNFHMYAYENGTMERGTNASGDNNKFNFYNREVLSCIQKVML